MPERKQFLKLNIITDDDTGMYHIGEIDGMFQSDTLEDYLQSHGEKGMIELSKTLTYLQWQIQDAWRELQTPEDTIAINAGTDMKEHCSKYG